MAASQGENQATSQELAASGPPRLSPRGDQQEDIENQALDAQTTCSVEAQAQFT